MNFNGLQTGADRESCPRGLIGRLVPHHSLALLIGVLRPPLIRSQTPLFGSSSGLFLSPQKKPPRGRLFYGADRETRTPDPLITNQLLYQLSYVGICFCKTLYIKDFWLSIKIVRDVWSFRNCRKAFKRGLALICSCLLLGEFAICRYIYFVVFAKR